MLVETGPNRVLLAMCCPESNGFGATLADLAPTPTLHDRDTPPARPRRNARRVTLTNTLTCKPRYRQNPRRNITTTHRRHHYNCCSCYYDHDHDHYHHCHSYYYHCYHCDCGQHNHFDYGDDDHYGEHSNDDCGHHPHTCDDCACCFHLHDHDDHCNDDLCESCHHCSRSSCHQDIDAATATTSNTRTTPVKFQLLQKVG